MKSVVLRLPPTRAFALFTGQASRWWPESRRHTDDPTSAITILPSGRFWERAADGAEVELGRVLVWEPPHRLELDFYPGTDAEHPTRAVVRFEAEGEGTRVTIEHGPTAASAAIWNERAPAFDRSWVAVIAALAAAEAGAI